MFALPIAIISARIYYVIFEWGYYKNHISEIPAIWHGGIAIHGGLIGAIVILIGRFFIVRMRTDSLMLTSHLRIAQVISIAIILTSVLLMTVRKMKGFSKDRYLNTEV